MAVIIRFQCVKHSSSSNHGGRHSLKKSLGPSTFINMYFIPCDHTSLKYRIKQKQNTILERYFFGVTNRYNINNFVLYFCLKRFKGVLFPNEGLFFSKYFQKFF